MACRLPHSVKQMQVFIQKQCDKEDVDRQKAIIDVMNQLRLAKAKKERMRQRYAKCTNISAERKAVIDKFLNEEAKKDEATEDTLWGCVSHIQSNISNKIRWNYEKNKVVGSVSQQVTPLFPGYEHGSTSSDAPRFVEQQQSPTFTGYADEADNPFGLTAKQLYDISVGERTFREFEAEQAKLQQEWEEKRRKDEEERNAFIEEFPGYRSPSYDSACGEHSN